MNFKFLQDLPKITRVLLLINIAFFVISFLKPELNYALALYYFENTNFRPYQLLTHIFMHGNLMHLAFNMYALVIFGSVVEKQLGEQRFLLLYFFAAIGAFSLQSGITWYQCATIPQEVLNDIHLKGAELLVSKYQYSDAFLNRLNRGYNTPSVGASGAIMGLLIGFAMLFPNAKLQIILIPISLKAKYFIPIYMLIELFMGVKNFSWDNIAHFAHLGGAVFGAILMFYWKSKKRAY